MDRLTYELPHFVSLAFIVALTSVSYIWGHREKRNRDAIVDLEVSSNTTEEVAF